MCTYGTETAAAESATDNEVIAVTVPAPGWYSVLVVPDEEADGQAYTLTWSHAAPPPPAPAAMLLESEATEQTTKIDVELVVRATASSSDTSATGCLSPASFSFLTV